MPADFASEDGRVGEVGLAGCPYPVVDAVGMAGPAHDAVHRVGRDAEQRALAFPGEGDVLDGVAAGEHQLADVPLHLRRRPRIPGVGRVAVADLVAAEGVGGRRGHRKAGGQRGPSPAPVQQREETADGVEHAATAMADEPDDIAAARSLMHDAEALRPVPARRTGHRRDGMPLHLPVGSTRQDEQRLRGRPSRRVPGQPRPSGDLFREYAQAEGTVGRRERRCSDDRGPAQVDRFVRARRMAEGQEQSAQPEEGPGYRQAGHPRLAENR